MYEGTGFLGEATNVAQGTTVSMVVSSFQAHVLEVSGVVYSVQKLMEEVGGWSYAIVDDVVQTKAPAAAFTA